MIIENKHMCKIEIFILLKLIPVISSLTPITTLLPLVGVLTITGLKDAYDDVVRKLVPK